MIWVIIIAAIAWAIYMVYKENTTPSETSSGGAGTTATTAKPSGKSLPVNKDIRGMLIDFLDITREINEKMPYASNNYINIYGGIKNGTGVITARFDKDWGGTDTVLTSQLGYTISDREPGETETGWWMDGTNVCFKGYGMTGFDTWLRNNMDDVVSVKYDIKGIVESYFPGMKFTSLNAYAYEGSVSSFLIIGR